MRIRGLLPALALALCTTALPAWAADPLPLIDAEAGSGPRWVSYRFTTAGSPARFEIGARSFSRGEFLAGYLYDANDRLVAGIGWISVGWKSGYALDLPAAGVHVGAVESPEPDGDIRIILAVNDPPADPPLAGTYKILLLTAGDAEAWDYAARGNGITGFVKDLGDRTFFYLSSDFDSTAQADAHALLDVPDAVRAYRNLGARVTVLGHKTIDILDTLIVDFSSAAFVPSQTFSVDGPDGRIDCGFFGCGFNRFAGPYHHGPGRYTFNTSGVNAGLSYMAELVLCGADARLPAT